MPRRVVSSWFSFAAFKAVSLSPRNRISIVLRLVKGSLLSGKNATFMIGLDAPKAFTNSVSE